jgi:hypothetical protein
VFGTPSVEERQVGARIVVAVPAESVTTWIFFGDPLTAQRRADGSLGMEEARRRA